jgi:hypothetical protein
MPNLIIENGRPKGDRFAPTVGCRRARHGQKEERKRKESGLWCAVENLSEKRARGRPLQKPGTEQKKRDRNDSASARPSQNQCEVGNPQVHGRERVARREAAIRRQASCSGLDAVGVWIARNVEDGRREEPGVAGTAVGWTTRSLGLFPSLSNGRSERMWRRRRFSP